MIWHRAEVAIVRAFVRDQEAGQSSTTDNMSLQNLGIPTQTIFYSRTTEDTGDRGTSSRLHQIDNWPRRFSADTGRSPSTLDLTRSPRLSGEGGHAVEDLRRRLALAGSGGSTTSLNSVTAVSPSSTPSRQTQRAVDSDEASIDGFGSSATIRADGPGVRPRSRIHPNGVDVGRVSPAVAQDMTNANGLINVEFPYRIEDEAYSEQSTPVLGAADHNRRDSRQLAPSAPRFTSTYGKCRRLNFLSCCCDI
jgi:phosphoinositide-3-kinase regulatory subunit 4